MTQVQLAKQARIGQSALSSIERGDTIYLRGGTLVHLADALGVSANWLESGLGDPQQPLPATTDSASAAALYARLNQANREVWMSIGQTLAAAQSHTPSPATPYPDPPRSVAKKR